VQYLAAENENIYFRKHQYTYQWRKKANQHQYHNGLERKKANDHYESGSMAVEM